MLLERRTVSRKTPLDGRLEITKRAAEQCARLGAEFDLHVASERVAARLGTMECTCRGTENPHVHYFLESDALKGFAAGSDVDVELDAERRIVRVGPSEG